jgi:hypothetical protein
LGALDRAPRTIRRVPTMLAIVAAVALLCLLEAFQHHGRIFL